MSSDHSSSERISVSVPIIGDTAHNATVATLVGNLVIHWANCESVLFALLQELAGGTPNTAGIIWKSHLNTRSRVELLKRLIVENIRNDYVKDGCIKKISHFYSLTKRRNFWCHALYVYNSADQFAYAQTFDYVGDGPDPKAETRHFNKQTANEIQHTTKEIQDLIPDLWGCVIDLQRELGTQHVELPTSSPAPAPSKRSHPDQQSPHSAASPPEPSQE